MDGSKEITKQAISIYSVAKQRVLDENTLRCEMHGYGYVITDSKLRTRIQNFRN